MKPDLSDIAIEEAALRALGKPLGKRRYIGPAILLEAKDPWQARLDREELQRKRKRHASGFVEHRK